MTQIFAGYQDSSSFSFCDHLCLLAGASYPETSLA
jgi:hypothetical protein